ncbi:MAG: palindromic element RPE2 domain-containing protein [Candidatus Tisiphia sp.]|nr:palindromic element RPE2 domain-containing protein [Candidatus Tisiphia sp.]
MQKCNRCDKTQIYPPFIVNSGELGSRNDGATPISNRRALSDDVTNFPSIDYNNSPYFN